MMSEASAYMSMTRSTPNSCGERPLRVSRHWRAPCPCDRAGFYQQPAPTASATDSAFATLSARSPRLFGVERVIDIQTLALDIIGSRSDHRGVREIAGNPWEICGKLFFPVLDYIAVYPTRSRTPPTCQIVERVSPCTKRCCGSGMALCRQTLEEREAAVTRTRPREGLRTNGL